MLVLRGLSVFFLVLALLSPGLQWFRSAKDVPIAVVWDGSSSMSEPDGQGGRTRWAEAWDAWSRVRGVIPGASFRHYILGSTARPMDESEIETVHPSDDICSFSGLETVVSTGPFRAVFFFSDGRSGDRSISNPGVPVFSLGVGGSQPSPDVAVDALQISPLAFVGTPIKISGHVSVGLPLPQSVAVELLEKDKVRARTALSLSSGGAPFSLSYSPTTAGFVRGEVRVSSLPGERRLANNTRSFAVEVQRDRVRTLYIAGRPGPHYHFLRSQLKNDPSVELVSFVILRDPEDGLAYRDLDLSLIPFPSGESLVTQLPTFDVVILEEFSGARFGLGASFFSALEKRIRAGGGYLVIQGSPGDSPSGGTTVRTGEGLSPWAPGPWVSGPERFRLKVKDPDHSFFATGSSLSGGWAGQTFLEGEGLFPPGVRAGGRVLAVEPVGELPVLAEAALGQGRVLGLANVTSWRWALASGRRGEGPIDYQRFWENVIRWLADTPGAGPLRLERPAGPLIPGEPWSVRIRSFTGSPRPPRVWAVSPGEARIPLVARAADGAGNFTADFIPMTAGFYEIHAQSGPAFRDHTWVEVASFWDEIQDTRPDFERLEELSRISAGRFTSELHRDHGVWKKWFSVLRYEQKSFKVGTEIFFTFLALLILFFEWIVRRFRGLP